MYYVWEKQEAVEARLAERGRSPATSDLAEMDALWDAVKAQEKAAKASRG